jgi:hypothetical protein
MAATKATVEEGSTGGRPGLRRHPDQRLLLLGSAGVLLGSFLPWLQTGLGTLSGFEGAGIYTFYAGVLGLAGALVPSRTLAIWQGAIMAAAAIGLPLWQVARALNLVGLSGWTPGVGLALVFGAGVFTARSVWLIAQDE